MEMDLEPRGYSTCTKLTPYDDDYSWGNCRDLPANPLADPFLSNNISLLIPAI